MSEDPVVEKAVEVFSGCDQASGAEQTFISFRMVGHSMIPYADGWLHLIWENDKVVNRYFEPWENDDDG